MIQAFADRIVGLLKVRDPLSETVHLGPLQLLAYSIGGMASEMIRRATGRRPVSKPQPAHDDRDGGSQCE